MRKGNDIAERLLDLAVTCIRIASRLPRHPAGKHVAQQLVRASTSAGANYEEGRAAESRQDFVHKLGVSAKETRETRYWLTLISRNCWGGQDLDSVTEESRQLAAILGDASVRTARNGPCAGVASDGGVGGCTRL